MSSSHSGPASGHTSGLGPDSRTLAREGFWYCLLAFGWWGVAPIYFRLMPHIPPGEQLAHRVVWSVAVLVLLMLVRRRWAAIAAAIRTPSIVGRLAVSGALIAVNWLIFLWAVNAGHILEASLGYYINPLMNVALAVVVLKERLSHLRSLAIAIAALGVGATLLAGGTVPWVALSLASTFAVYGLLRKTTPVDALTGLTIETSLALIPALAYLLWLGAETGRWFGTGSAADIALLLGTSIITIVPLAAFAAGARRLSLATVGIMQYLGPTLQFIIAIGFYGETFGQERLILFGCIWLALALYTLDIFKTKATR